MGWFGPVGDCDCCGGDEPCCDQHTVSSFSISLGTDPFDFCCDRFVGTYIPDQDAENPCVYYHEQTWSYPDPLYVEDPSDSSDGYCWHARADQAPDFYEQYRAYYVQAFRVWITLNNTLSGYAWDIFVELDVLVTVFFPNGEFSNSVTAQTFSQSSGGSGPIYADSGDLSNCEPGTIPFDVGGDNFFFHPNGVATGFCEPFLNMSVQIDPA